MPLPIHLALLLAPWFRESALDRTAKLLADGPLPQLIFYRTGAALVLPGEKCWCALVFEESARISQGFRLTLPYCSRCGRPRKTSELCAHLGALAVVALDQTRDRPVPLPLLFCNSLWQRLGVFLAEKGGKPGLAEEGESSRAGVRPERVDGLSCCWKSLSLQCRLSGELLSGFELTTEELPGVEGAALRYLRENTRSETEAALNASGRQSRGQQSDDSRWMWLCRALFLACPNPTWSSRLLADGTLALTAADGERPFLELLPIRDIAWSALQVFEDEGLASKLAPARAFVRVTLEPVDSSLRITARVALPDGRAIDRAQLRQAAYGNFYSFDGRAFFAVTEQADDLLLPEEATALPLFALAAAADRPDERVIPADEVPAFLARHRDALTSDENDIDPRLAEFSVGILPDGLHVTGFREERDWCFLSADFLLADSRISLAELLDRRRRGKEFVAAGGKWLQLKDSPLGWLLDHAQTVDSDGGGQGTVRLRRQELFALGAMLPEIVSPERPQLAELLRQRTAGVEIEPADLPLPGHLRGYQRKGVAWLHHLRRNGIGALLADDMGLGKTLQALAFIATLDPDGANPVLIVCPASVLPHWADKLTRFHPDLPFRVHYGLDREKGNPADTPVLLTTYGILRRDIDLLGAIFFSLVVFDEIGALRNRGTETHRAARKLTAETVLGLTGTPLENSLDDLHALFEFCVPGLLPDNAAFQNIYRRPIEERGDNARRRILTVLIHPFMLRRSRQQVLAELPELTEDLRTCVLSDQQKDLYRQVLEGDGRQLREEIADHADQSLPYLRILAVIQQLKQICNHPCQLAGSVDYHRYESGKWELFREILDESLASGLKVVVFSQYTRMLDIIEKYLEDNGIGWRGLRGGMSPGRRQRNIDAFNADPQIAVFSASLLAGGVGIDLTGAQAVIHYDRWWTAAKEEQANARVHRMGQRRPVQVIKFVSADTIEEKINALVEKKLRLADELVAVDDAFLIKKLQRDDILSLLSWGGE